MDDLGKAIALSFALSVLICCIELIYRSKTAALGALWSGSALLYLLVVVIGNTATTFIAAAGGDTLIPGGLVKDGKLALAWFWYAFMGVFGFEVLLQNINVTFADKGVLSINDWISKARASAVASAIKYQAGATVQKAEEMANTLRALPVAELNARVLDAMGQARLLELDNTAAATGADSRLTKALSLAHYTVDKAPPIG